MVVVGSLAGYDTDPAWYLNVRANPECWVQLDDRKMTAVARDATDDERAELWPQVTAKYKTYAGYQEKTDREIPLVLLDPVG